MFPYQSGWSFIWPGYDDGIHKAREVAEKAVALDPDASFTNWRLGWALIFLRRHDDAVTCFDRALEIEPNNAEAYSYFAEVLNFAGDPGRAVEMSKTAIGYDPVVPPNCAFHLGHSYFLLGRLEEPVAQIQRSIDLAPSFPVSRMIMAAALTELQRDDEAGEHIATLRAQHPQHSLATVNQR